MGLAKNRPPEQGPRLADGAHQQIINTVKPKVRLHRSGDQKKHMLGGIVLREEDFSPLEREYG